VGFPLSLLSAHRALRILSEASRCGQLAASAPSADAPTPKDSTSRAAQGGINWNASLQLHCVQYGQQLCDWRRRRGNAIRLTMGRRDRGQGCTLRQAPQAARQAGTAQLRYRLASHRAPLPYLTYPSLPPTAASLCSSVLPLPPGHVSTPTSVAPHPCQSATSPPPPPALALINTSTHDTVDRLATPAERRHGQDGTRNARTPRAAAQFRL
jgi:hypothetical protein